MPELPEIENLKLQLDPMLRGAKVTQIIFHRKKIRDEIDIEGVEKILSLPILEVTRRAKYFFWETEAGSVGFHLGMSGQFVIKPDSQIHLPHTHVIFSVKNSESKPLFLHFVDPRRFGRIFPNFDKQDHKLLKHLGPEPLAAVELGEYLWQKARGRKTSVKSFLMDQTVVVGVGNIYCCEALYLARVRPQKSVSKISKLKFVEIAGHIQSVLAKSIKAGGTSFKDFLHIDLHRGGFQSELFVYGRAGGKCSDCANSIENVKIAGRSSFYCPVCQK